MLKPEQILYRVVRFYQQTKGESNQLPPITFVPRANHDQGQLSVFNAELIEPEECLRRFNRDPARKPATKVAQITVADVQFHELKIIQPDGSDPAHLLIDFRGIEESKIIQIAEDLLDKSQKMGLAYPKQ